MSIILTLKQKLINSPKKPTIVYAEGWNKNIQEAALEVAANNTITPLLLFHTTNEVPNNFPLKHLIIDQTNLSQYSDLLFELRKSKGMTKEQADQLVVQPNYLASLLVKSGQADGEICGIDYTTRDTLKPALQIVKTAPNAKLVTSAFILEKQSQQYVFGDCAININPNSEELANIAEMISIFAKQTVGFDHVQTALLSYSTCGSGSGESVDKVKQAYELLKNKQTQGIDYFGEIQFDAAFDENVMAKKAKTLSWHKQANTFVFPTIDAGNIGYKIAQRMGGYAAIGPVLLGLAKPINDLSRGASKDDVVGLSYITGCQCLI